MVGGVKAWFNISSDLEVLSWLPSVPGEILFNKEIPAVFGVCKQRAEVGFLAKTEISQDCLCLGKQG